MYEPQPKPEPMPVPGRDEPEPLPGDPQPSPDEQIHDPPVVPDLDTSNEVVFDENETAK